MTKVDLNSACDKYIIERLVSFTVMPAPGGHPVSFAKKVWIPAFAGMTSLHEKNSPTPDIISLTSDALELINTRKAVH